jgi:perosamine synthetase
MTRNIPLFRIYSDEDDLEKVNEILSSGMNWATGSSITQFEKSVADYIGTKYAITFNSGTSALHAALIAHGIGDGDEVIVPSFTFISTANSPLFVNARPVFADIEESTFGIDPEDCVEKITNKTRAIIPVHYGGCPCKIRELREIADDHNLLLIEDAAEAFGARIKERNIGTFGESAMMSFCQNKIITTGEGGAIVTDSNDIAEKLKLIRSHGRLETSDYFSTGEVLDYITLGYNFRMSNITAALGLSQINKVEKLISLRRKNADFYIQFLKDCLKCKIFFPPENYYHVYQLFSVLVPNRDDLMKFLQNKGISTKIYFPPVHKTTFYQNVLRYDCNLPTTIRISGDILSLPFYPGMMEEDIRYVCDSVKEFLE